jgi:hypothetical protein
MMDVERKILNEGYQPKPIAKRDNFGYRPVAPKGSIKIAPPRGKSGEVRRTAK